MEQNLPIITKKVWKMMKMALLMLRKGICKKKLLLDLNLMMKRAKLTAKAASASATTVVWSTHQPREYEFDCKNTPLYRHYFNKNKNGHDHHNNYYIMPSPNVKDHTEFEAVNKVLESMVSNKLNGKRRQLSITDSPFMSQNEEVNNKYGQRVDEAAEDFIKKFYSQLKAQNC
ncbi:DNA ligase [Bienertia sinuspersici]